MNKKKKYNSSHLVSCPYCKVKVNKRKLEEHLLKVHQTTMKTLIFQQSLYQELNYWFTRIDEWLYKYMYNCYLIYEIECLKIMFAEEVLKYKFNLIKTYLSYDWTEEQYRKESINLRKSFKEIKDDIAESNDFNKIHECNDAREVDWNECNNHEKMFGKKYIGYLRRENNNSKFGSYPLHDDYSEDSNPNKFTNLDY